MAFKLELATYEDIDTLIDVYFHAFAADPLYSFLYPNLTWEEKVRFEASGPKRVFKEQPWVKLYKLTEEETGYVRPPSPPSNLQFQQRTEINGDGGANLKFLTAD